MNLLFKKTLEINLAVIMLLFCKLSFAGVVSKSCRSEIKDDNLVASVRQFTAAQPVSLNLDDVSFMKGRNLIQKTSQVRTKQKKYEVYFLNALAGQNLASNESFVMQLTLDVEDCSIYDLVLFQ